jgi:hypothetical protein
MRRRVTRRDVLSVMAFHLEWGLKLPSPLQYL